MNTNVIVKQENYCTDFMVFSSGSRTRVYRFNSRRFICSGTEYYRFMRNVVLDWFSTSALQSQSSSDTTVWSSQPSVLSKDVSTSKPPSAAISTSGISYFRAYFSSTEFTRSLCNFSLLLTSRRVSIVNIAEICLKVKIKKNVAMKLKHFFVRTFHRFYVIFFPSKRCYLTLTPFIRKINYCCCNSQLGNYIRITVIPLCSTTLLWWYSAAEVLQTYTKWIYMPGKGALRTAING